MIQKLLELKIPEYYLEVLFCENTCFLRASSKVRQDVFRRFYFNYFAGQKVY